MTLESGVGAVARQISEVPACVLARCTSVQTRPPPETVSICPPERGPSDAASASSSSPGVDVLNDFVLRIPLPSAPMGATALPVTPPVPAAGFSLTMEPVGTVMLDAVVIAPTVRPAVVIAAVAAACVSATTFGTATRGGPEDTTSATALPVTTCVPAAGFSLTIEPAGTVELAAEGIAGTDRPSGGIAAH